ncbi:MAG: hypothetical protein JSS81_01860 [Acidobacteria bacterium]|nr:hypothetical protein [Acidobacteriota bacterium]
MRIKLLILLICLSALAAGAQTGQPRTVREFFNLLPQKYFALEGCEPAKDRNCEKARREYVENYLEVEDKSNGYWKSGCDGAQSCLTMALFKRPDRTYIVALKVENEDLSTNYFLEYKNGRWTDIGAQSVPKFSRNNIYELPREGTTVEVFARNKSDAAEEKGEKLYDLVWKNGKFSVKR